jgi:hypothetical protein
MTSMRSGGTESSSAISTAAAWEDRHHADDARTPRGRGAGAVEQVDPVPAGEVGEPALLGEHAAGSLASADVHLDHLRDAEFGPGALAVDEGDQLEVGPNLGELGEQVADVDLRAAGLAGDQEQQVEAYPAQTAHPAT